jgi:hypothetical protein
LKKKYTVRKIYFKHIFLALFIFTAIVSLAACENGTVTTTKSIEVSDTKTNTGLDIAGLHQADSVQILFFTDPFGKDSLRYTRYFKHYNTSDDSTVQPLLKNLDQLFLLRTEVMKCRSEGKIFFFKGTQELKTVYFNTQGASNKSDGSAANANNNCANMYFIKDGGFYYFPIQPATATLLRKLKPLAVKPSAEN